MSRRLRLLVLALSPAAGAAAQLDAFRYDPKLVSVGRVYQYLKSNRDGSHPANVTVYVAAADRLEALKWDEGGDAASFVVATMDWTRFSVRRFESWQLRRGEPPALRATLDVDADGVAKASFLPDKPIRLQMWPWHSYDFDFSSLGITLAHLARPEADFSFHRTDIMQEEGNVDFREVGGVRAHFQAIENHGGVEARRYQLEDGSSPYEGNTLGRQEGGAHPGIRARDSGRARIRRRPAASFGSGFDDRGGMGVLQAIPRRELVPFRLVRVSPGCNCRRLSVDLFPPKN